MGGRGEAVGANQMVSMSRATATKKSVQGAQCGKRVQCWRGEENWRSVYKSGRRHRGEDSLAGATSNAFSVTFFKSECGK